MLNFIIGAVVGGFVTLFCMALVSANKKAECAECDYYKSRFLYIVDIIKLIISKFRNDELTAYDAINQIENELRL
jgi:hypothetical protein